MAKAYSSTRITVPTKPQQAPKAYSYLRFSTPEQEEGDSIRRQISNTQAYAHELGLELDDTLRFEDKGISAFHGKNASEGALAEFLENVKAGKVPEGSFLIVEALDRVSRENPYEAMEVLNGILRQGISVAVASEREVYSRESLRKNPWEMLKPLMRFQTAHEESKKKSYRTLENWKAKRDAASAGKVMSTRGPAWLTYNVAAKAWEPIPERVAVVQRIFREFLEGRGIYAITSGLNADRIPTWGKKRNAEPGEFWGHNYIKKILFTPLVIGTIEPSTWERDEDGNKTQQMLKPIPNYYPAVIDEGTWNQAQALRKGFRAPRKAAEGATLGNLFSHLLQCAKCQGTASAVNKGNRAYVVCNRARFKASCEFHSVGYDLLEAAFLRDADRLLGTYPSGNDNETDAALERIEAALEALPEQLERLAKLYKASGSQQIADDFLATDAERVRLEAERNALLQRQAEISGPVVAKRVQALQDALSAEKVDRRHVNACLRLLVSAVEVDAENGIARFLWRHGGSSEIVFTIPGQDGANTARRMNLAKARAVLADKGHEAVIANLTKARAARAAKCAKARAAKATDAVSEGASVTPEDAAA